MDASELVRKNAVLEDDRERLSALLAESVVREASLFDPDRVGIALQAAFAGVTIPTYGWDWQYAERTQRFVRLLRAGISEGPPNT